MKNGDRNLMTFCGALIIMALLLLGAMPAASETGQTAAAPASPEVKKDAAVPEGETDLSINKVDRVEFTAAGRRDPFVSIILAAKEKLMETKKRSKNPLENFDVSDFKLIGIIYDGKKYYATVILPDQKSYNLMRGTQVGLYGGKVDEIRSTKIIVKEMVTDFTGNVKPRYTEIKLRKEEEQ